MLTVAQVAERLNCSESTVRSLIARGLLKYHRCPGIRVSEEQIAEYLEETKREREKPEPGKQKPSRPQLRCVKL